MTTVPESKTETGEICICSRMPHAAMVTPLVMTQPEKVKPVGMELKQIQKTQNTDTDELLMKTDEERKTRDDIYQ